MTSTEIANIKLSILRMAFQTAASQNRSIKEVFAEMVQMVFE